MRQLDLKKTDTLITIFAVLAVMIGIFLAGSYGDSWDEHAMISLGDAVQKAFQFPFSNQRIDYPVDRVLRYYGPAFSLITSALLDFLPDTTDHAQVMAFYSFFEFSTFLLGTVSLYVIAKRFLSDWTSLTIAGLFFTQPLFFGHAFINPKDIPFMGFFNATVACGLVMADRISSAAPEEKNGFSWKAVLAKRRPLSAYQTKRLAAAVVIFVVLVLSIWLCWDMIAGSISNLIENMFQAPDGSFSARLIDFFVSNPQKIPLSSYQEKAIHQLRKGLTAVAISSSLILVAIALWKTHSDVIKSLYQKFLGQTVSKPKAALQHIFNNQRWVWIVLTGILLGLTTAVRVVGPAALMLILVYFIVKDHRDWLIPITAVLVISCLVTYISWPNLWDAPVPNFIRSLREMSDFPWEGRVLFEGQLLTSESLPGRFLLKLILFQLTEPAVLLMLLGLGKLVFQSIQRRNISSAALLILCWTILPLLLVVIFQPRIYDNGRQFIFIYPPLFILAGIGLDLIFTFIKKNIWKITAAALVLLPGLLGIFQLHPYEYLYYNQFAGGIRGAYGTYELDYWGTTLRDAAEYLNEYAPQNANVAVMVAPHLLEAYLREDLVVTPLGDLGDAAWPDDFDYLVLFARANGDIKNTLNQEVVFRVVRDGVDLLTIEKIN